MITVNEKRIDVAIQKAWNVLDKKGHNRGRMVVKPTDTIYWHADRYPMLFRFRFENDENIDTYFEYPEGTFQDGESQKIEAEGELWVKIKDDILFDVIIVYEITILGKDQEERVTGCSEIKLIIRR